MMSSVLFYFFFFQAEDGIRDTSVTGVQTCALPIYRLGGLVNRLWREHWMDAEYFPEAATTAIREVPPHAHVNSRDVVAWAFATNAIPPQLDLRSEFGEPPLTVYNDGDVIIDVYFWLDGSTAIHQHAFAGAFFVLEGASVETVYEFRIGHRYN